MPLSRLFAALERLLFAVAFTLALCGLGFGIVVVQLKAERAADFREQARRVQAMRSDRPRAQALKADLGLDDALGLDRLRLLATHNSYRKRGDALGLGLIGLIEPDWPARLQYEHPDLTSQLNAGIRSMELDLRPKGRGFVLAHVPLVDERSVAPDFALALEELRLWSERNPRHAPILLLLELKEDYAFLDPALGPFDAAAFDRLDAALKSGLGATLYTPDDFRGLHGSPAQAVAARGWPALGELRGRILAVMHENPAYRERYLAGHAALAGRAMFTCAPGPRPLLDPLAAPDAVFAILNEARLQAGDIARALASGLVVRTRADADLQIASGALAAALSSGAQIVSTDFPPGWPSASGYAAALPGRATMDAFGGGPLRGSTRLASVPVDAARGEHEGGEQGEEAQRADE